MTAEVRIDMARLTSPRAVRDELKLETTGLKHRGIVALTVETPSSSRHRGDVPDGPPARWRTPEFLFYLIAFIVVVPFMFKVPMDLSESSHPNYTQFASKLSSGWIAGRKIDNSDRQYRSFRNNIPGLLMLALLHLASGKAYSFWYRMDANPLSQFTKARVTLSLMFSSAMLVVLHGASALKILVILSINFGLSKSVGGNRIGPLCLWVFNIAILFLNETYDGYRFALLVPMLEPLDSWQGFYPRWNITFNITVLRLISFAMDYHWASLGLNPKLDIAPQTEKERVAMSRSLSEYSYTNFLAYVLYPPLYIAGPIITYNNFTSQMGQPTIIPVASIGRYIGRFIFCLMTMELVLHFMYVVAIKDTKAWAGDTPAEISMIGFWNLLLVWLKLLIPWRFFRLWALADGIDPPENMVRCMANNYSALGFWRSWHRSYNIWTIRYIYIPVGGSERAILSTLLVFTFVAFWHDLSLRLLAWGWLISLFIIPELLGRRYMPASKYGKEPWYRHLCAAGAVLNITMMMTANLVGFVVGLDGMKHLAGELFGTLRGLQFVAFASICIFIAVQVMFEYREEEIRRGIHRRY